MWPYTAFLVLAIWLNIELLADGFCPALDEGYLQSLAQRVLNGELPYRDFYFLRTPLSVFMQAGIMSLFGDSFSLLWARILLQVQITGAIMAVSTIYFRRVKPWELFLLLSASYVVSSLLLTFPWYSYDAWFFAVVAAVGIYYRRYVTGGLVAFLAAMCKQNYVLLLPLALIGLWLYVPRSQKTVLAKQDILRMGLGFGAGIGTFVIYLMATGS